MTSSVTAIPQSPRLSRASRCSITELSPTINDQASKLIDGVVSLIWPYSSSTHRTAILLADPDFRIRREKGQTKVTFQGEAAVAVAESYVGIGDTVHLSLEGAQWAQPGEDVSTVGKRADWDLEYAGQVFMEVHRGTTPFAVVDFSHVPESVKGALHEIDGNGRFRQRTPRTRRSQDLWSSPAFAKQKSQLSHPLIEISEKSSVEDDGYVPGKGRKRTRFSRDSGSWRYLERNSGFGDENHAPENATPRLKQQEVLETTLDAAKSDHEDQEANSADVGAFEPLVLTPQHQDDAINHLDKAPEVLMPPPPQTLERQQLTGDPSGARLAVAVEKISVPEMEERLRAEPIATPPRATTPRLRPLTSPGLPLISPLVKRQGAFAGYFPPDLNAQSELDSGVEGLLKGFAEEIEPNIASPATTSQLSAHPPAKSFSEDATVVTLLLPLPAGQMVDLISPTEEGEGLKGEERGRKLQTEHPPSDHYASSLTQSVIPPNEFEHLNDSPVEPKPVNRRASGATLDLPSKSVAEATLLESPPTTSSARTISPQVVPPSPGMGEEESKDAVPGFAEQIERLSPLQQPSGLSTEQIDSVSGLHVPDRIIVVEEKGIEQSDIQQEDLGQEDLEPKEIDHREIGQQGTEQQDIEQIDIEEDHIRPVSFSAPRRPALWTEALEVSAREVRDYDLSISAPPFPFKQGWDNKAKKESEARQALRSMQANGFYMSHRVSYDGVEDGVRSPSGGGSDAMSDLESGSRSLFYDYDGNLVQEKIEDLEERSQLKGDDSQLTGGDESTSARTEDDDAEAIEAVVLESDGNIPPSTAHLDMEHGTIMPLKRVDTETEVSSKSVESAIHPVSDGFGQQSRPPTEEQDYTQPPLEMSQSPPPSLAAGEDGNVFTGSSTLMPHLPLDPHIGEHTAPDVGAAKATFAYGPFYRQPDQHVPQADQLATPDNTQEEVQFSQSQGLQDELRGDKPQVELPPSPQNTQDLQDSPATKFEQPLDAKDEQHKSSVDPAAAESDSRLEETDLNEKLAAPSSEETQLRRSSRLSGKMPLLGKDPSEIVSPYFTPKRAGQESKNDKASSSPLHRPLSPSAETRDNVVVLIPPAGRRSSFGAPEPVTSGTLTLEGPPSSKRPVDGKGFSTPRSYYPSLSSLPTHFNDQVDVLVVVTTTSKQPQRAKSGPKDYFVSLKLADSSCDADDSVSLQLFRPYKNALPTCARGDVVLLRGVKVQTRRTLGTRGKSQARKELDGMMLLSTDSSAWAVFKFPPTDSIPAMEGRPGSRDGCARSPTKRGTPIKLDVQINGPPVEYGAEERAFVRGLNKWWIAEGEAVFPDVKSKHSQPIKGKGKEKLDELEMQEKYLHEHELRDGTAYGDMIGPKSMHEQFHRNEQFKAGDNAEELYEHELRDGVAYGDTISQIPIHEHQHDHNHDHSHFDDPNGRRLGGPDDEEQLEEEEHTLYEHELRDGMAYGDTISQTPIHQHFHHADHSSDSHDHDGSSISLEPRPHSSHLSHSSPPQEADQPIYSHNLRYGIPYAGTNGNVKTAPVSHSITPRRISTSRRSAVTYKTSEGSEGEHKGEAEGEAIHRLRDGTKYTMSDSPAQGSSESETGTGTGTGSRASARPKSNRGKK